jgi:hypothetical protein
MIIHQTKREVGRTSIVVLHVLVLSPTLGIILKNRHSGLHGSIIVKHEELPKL